MVEELVFKDAAAAEYDSAFAHVTAHFMKEGVKSITRFDVDRLLDSGRWTDVLIDAEQVCRIILSLHRDQPLEVPAVAGFDTRLALVVRHATAFGQKPAET